MRGKRVWMQVSRIDSYDRQAVICIAKYPNTNGIWTDPWRVIVNGEGRKFGGWPHPFPPTHFMDVGTPETVSKKNNLQVSLDDYQAP